jgi:tetratricopeptide (TPR) repeat protein
MPRYLIVLLCLASFSKAQTPPAPPSLVEKAISSANTGHCPEAVPQLARSLTQITDPDLKRRAGVAGVKCSMALNDTAHALTFLGWLNRQFPRDPSVLYLSTHVYSDLSVRASNELLATSPSSAEVHELNAEALETMGKWKEATDEYQTVLAKNPHMPGIHYRIGRLLLSQQNPPPTIRDQAKQEFEAELKIDPTNAGAYFVLGELARQAEQWPVAIDQFTKATKYDSSFAEAFLGLGRSYLSSEQAEAAIPPLETAAKLQGANPETHFQLATAYRRAGRKADADREFAIHRDLAAKAQNAQDQIKRQVSGTETPPAQQQ